MATNRIDWNPNPGIFAKTNHLFGPLEVDLFATHLSTQCQRYFSWRPDLYAEATDAFLKYWTHLRGYANPPRNLIGKAICQVQSQQAKIALVAPVWRIQPWYPILLTTLIHYPRIIPPTVEITTSQPPPPMVPQLAVWHISRRDTEANNFLRKLQISCSAMSSSSVAQWLKFLLEASGIDASILNTHLVLGASSNSWDCHR